MRTEKEYSELFKKSYSENSEIAQKVESIANCYWTDLTAHLNLYFDHTDREQITILAAQKLAKAQNQEAWPEVIRDFLNHNYWNFKPTQNKPQKKQTEEQKIFWKLFKYAWAFFQSMIILKIAVYYFGLESAENPEETSVIWVWFFFALSAGSLAFFAYRNRKDIN